MTSARLRTFVLLGLLLLAALDFWQRIYVPRNVAARSAESLRPATVAAPQPAGRVNADLVAWLPDLQPLSAVEATGGPTDWVLTLLAVFVDRQAPFAVIRAMPAAGGAAKVQRAGPGDELYGYKVVGIEPAYIRLEGPQGPRELEVFRPSGSSLRGSGSPPATATQSADSRAAANESPPAGSMTQAAPPGSAYPARPTGVAGTQTAPGGAGEYTKENIFELPESMRGLPVVEDPAPADHPKSVAPAPAGQPSKKKPQQ